MKRPTALLNSCPPFIRPPSLHHTTKTTSHKTQTRTQNREAGGVPERVRTQLRRLAELQVGIHAVVTFGAHMVGNAAFATYYKETLGLHDKTLRWVQHGVSEHAPKAATRDAATRFPGADNCGYAHVGRQWDILAKNGEAEPAAGGSSDPVWYLQETPGGGDALGACAPVVAWDAAAAPYPGAPDAPAAAAAAAASDWSAAFARASAERVARAGEAGAPAAGAYAAGLFRCAKRVGAAMPGASLEFVRAFAPRPLAYDTDARAPKNCADAPAAATGAAGCAACDPSAAELLSRHAATCLEALGAACSCKFVRPSEGCQVSCAAAANPW